MRFTNTRNNFYCEWLRSLIIAAPAPCRTRFMWVYLTLQELWKRIRVRKMKTEAAETFKRCFCLLYSVSSPPPVDFIRASTGAGFSWGSDSSRRWLIAEESSSFCLSGPDQEKMKLADEQKVKEMKQTVFKSFIWSGKIYWTILSCFRTNALLCRIHGCFNFPRTHFSFQWAPLINQAAVTSCGKFKEEPCGVLGNSVSFSWRNLIRLAGSVFCFLSTSVGYKL